MEKEELDKTVQQIKEDLQFKKEFERELKRFQKMADALKKDSDYTAGMMMRVGVEG